MYDYDHQALAELAHWQRQMLRKPSRWNKFTRRLQRKVNSYIPEKIHQAITTVIKQMVRAVLTGSHYTTQAPLEIASLQTRETLVRDMIHRYRTTAAVEGGITGAGGILLGLADFPLLIAIKLKLLFEIAALYGYTTADYKERIYLLLIFQLAFSSQEQRRETYLQIANWQEASKQLPESLHEFEWRTFQQEYRDYIDLAKLAQLLPVVGAPVGAVVNYRLLKKLGLTAMNAYRMRWLAERDDLERLTNASMLESTPTVKRLFSRRR